MATHTPDPETHTPSPSYQPGVNKQYTAPEAHDALRKAALLYGAPPRKTIKHVYRRINSSSAFHRLVSLRQQHLNSELIAAEKFVNSFKPILRNSIKNEGQKSIIGLVMALTEDEMLDKGLPTNQFKFRHIRPTLNRESKAKLRIHGTGIIVLNKLLSIWKLHCSHVLVVTDEE